MALQRNIALIDLDLAIYNNYDIIGFDYNYSFTRPKLFAPSEAGLLGRSRDRMASRRITRALLKYCYCSM